MRNNDVLKIMEEASKATDNAIEKLKVNQADIYKHLESNPELKGNMTALLNSIQAGNFEAMEDIANTILKNKKEDVTSSK